MGFFNKILVQETSTGNLVDITNLDEKHYESFLNAMQKLQSAYIVAKESKSKTRIFTDTVSPLGLDILKGKL
jgi:chromosome condensin MukBEF MukE localization factor